MARRVLLTTHSGNKITITIMLITDFELTCGFTDFEFTALAVYKYIVVTIV